jgi:GT2 family glycosyltransferase
MRRGERCAQARGYGGAFVTVRSDVAGTAGGRDRVALIGFVVLVSLRGMRVSVIVANFNKEKTLGACLAAVFAQTYALDEVIVVDDASTDRSVEIAGGFPCTVVTSAVNRGVSAARNAGAAKARGDVLFFVDSDIAIAPTAVERALAILDAHPDCGVVQGIYAPEPLFDDGPVERFKMLDEHFWRRGRCGVASSTLFALTAVRRGVFDEVGGFDERLRDAEDVEWGSRLPTSWEIRMSADVVGRHDDVDRFGAYVFEQFRRARTYARTRITTRAESRDHAAIVAMGASLLAVVALPLVVVSPYGLVVPLVAVAAVGVADRGVLGFIRRRTGRLFAAYAFVLKFSTHLAEGAGMAVGVLESRRRGAA